MSKNDVPDQKASMAVPPSFEVMIGSAILREVASSAAARVMRHMEEKARMNAVVGLNSIFSSITASIVAGFSWIPRGRSEALALEDIGGVIAEVSKFGVFVDSSMVEDAKLDTMSTQVD